MASKVAAAFRLTGTVVGGKWSVVAPAPRLATQTGAFFSVGYIVRDASGKEGFLKALNFEAALRSSDPARVMLAMTEQFTFEVDLLNFCNGRKMSRVVRAVDHGVVSLGSDASEIVQYIVFEPADGDLRKLISGFDEIDLVWAITIAHQAAVGLAQLHKEGIAHQDLKPSNILSFGGTTDAKIADLGCASKSGSRSPRDGVSIPGAKQYAAPELVWGQIDADWQIRRVAPDLFQLGSLLTFLLCGSSMLSLILSRTPPEFRPRGYGGSFTGGYEEAKDAVLESYADCLDYLKDVVPDGEIFSELLGHIGTLCHPDPSRRGFGGRRWQGKVRYSLEPYVSQFALLKLRAERAARQAVRRVEGDYDAH